MKLPTLYLTTLILTGVMPLCANAIDLSSVSKSTTDKVKAKTIAVSEQFQASAMIASTAKELNMSEGTVAASFGSLLKVAQDNLSKDNFALISKAVPDAQAYVNKAPKVSKSSMTSLFSNAGDMGKKAESIDYLNSAFSKLGISTSQIPTMLNSFSGYLDKNGYSEAATTLKQGLNFL